MNWFNVGGPDPVPAYSFDKYKLTGSAGESNIAGVQFVQKPNSAGTLGLPVAVAYSRREVTNKRSPSALG